MKVLTDNQYYSQIANVIREQNGTNNTYKPPQMVSALKDLFYEEVVGVLPISFNGIRENLLDYRIYGASGGVGDRTNNLLNPSNIVDGYYLNTTTGLPSPYLERCATVQPININYSSLILKFSSTISNVKFLYSLFMNDTLIARVSGKNSGTSIDCSNANKIYICFYAPQGTNLSHNDLSNIILSPIDVDYEPFGYKVPVTIRKNIFNENSELNTNGTLGLDEGVYPFSVGNNRRTFFFNVKANTTYTFLCSSEGDRFVVCEYNRIVNPANYSVSNRLSADRVIYSQSSGLLRYSFTTSNNAKMVAIYYSLNTLPQDVQLFEENATTTNIYLNNAISEGESVSLSDTNVNIPTLRGTNVLTVDTTVQPSKVYVKSRKESQYETIMRERYEEAQAQLDAL